MSPNQNDANSDIRHFAGPHYYFISVEAGFASSACGAWGYCKMSPNQNDANSDIRHFAGPHYYNVAEDGIEPSASGL